MNSKILNNRMVYEVIDFANVYHNNDLEKCHELLEHSLRVMETVVTARKDAGIIFPADSK